MWFKIQRHTKGTEEAYSCSSPRFAGGPPPPMLAASCARPYREMGVCLGICVCILAPCVYKEQLLKFLVLDLTF